MMSSWVYLTLGVIIALIALGAVTINTALEQASTQVNLGIAIDTKTRYVSESNNTILNSTQQFIEGEDVMITTVIIELQGRVGGNWGGLEPQDKITLAVSAEEPIYGDISYFDVKKQEWIIVKQALSKEFKIAVQIPEEQSIFNFKWGTYVLNPNDEPVRANVKTIITKSSDTTPINQISAEESAIKLTPFSISFAKEDFTKFARVHGIIWLKEGESADLHVRIQNNDDKQHEIKFHIQVLGRTPAMEEVVSMSIKPETIVVEPHSSGETVLQLTAGNFVPETQTGTIGIAARSTTFGAIGEFFYLVVGNNLTESDTYFFDTPIREGAPGAITTHINKDPDFEYFENLFGYRFALPSYLPGNYTIQDVDLTASSVRILYSPVEVTNQTGFYEFFRDGGIFVIYNKDPLDFEEFVLSGAAYGSQQVMVNDYIGIAWDQREQVTVAGNRFKSESGLLLFKDKFSIELRGGVPLEELLKVAASLQYQDQELDVFNVVNTTRLISLDEQKEFCCISLAISPDGKTIAYSTSIYDNETGPQTAQLWLYDVRDDTTREVNFAQDVVNTFNTIYDPSFSSDGKELLFLSEGCKGICVLSIPEQKLRMVPIAFVHSADFMPDGSLVLARNIGNETIGNLLQIWIFEDQTPQKLLYSENYDDSLMLHVRASPDGKKIAFHSERVLFGNKIYVLDLESGQLDRVVENGVKPRWSPDSNFLIYNETPRRAPPGAYQEFLNNNPNGIIKMVDVDTKEITTLVRPADRVGFYDLAVFPDGSKLIYGSYENIYDEGALIPRTHVSSGIYTAELSQAIPEFPFVWLVLIASFFVVSIYTRRLWGKYAQI